MNITNFRKLKDRGLMEVKRYGPDYMLVKRKFDPDTGEEKNPDVEAFKREQFEALLAQHQEAVMEITALLQAFDSVP